MACQVQILLDLIQFINVNDGDGVFLSVDHMGLQRGIYLSSRS
jgi:hypothetical protein